METQVKDNSSLLFEQYKVYIESLNQVRTQHSQTRAFYVSVVSALLVFLSFLGSENVKLNMSIPGQYAVSILGIILCFAWHVQLRSYRKIYRVKFSILREMEKQLPFPLFEREWTELKKSNYGVLLKTELFVSFAVALPFVLLLCSLL